MAAELLAMLKPRDRTAKAREAQIPYVAKVLADAIKTKPTQQDSPTLLILMGPPGCGKSTIKTTLTRRLGMHNYVSIDTDDVRTTLTNAGLEFPDLDAADPKVQKKAFEVMRGVTNAFNSKLLDHAFGGDLNAVLDSTGVNFGANRTAAAQAEAAGYKVVLAIVYASEDTCATRVAARNAALLAKPTGRVQLPLAEAKNRHEGITRMLQYYLGPLVGRKPFARVHELLLYNNEGAEPRLVLEMHGDKVVRATPGARFFGYTVTDDPSAPLAKAKAGGRLRSRRSRRSRSRRQTLRKPNRRNARGRMGRRTGGRTVRKSRR